MDKRSGKLTSVMRQDSRVSPSPPSEFTLQVTNPGCLEGPEPTATSHSNPSARLRYNIASIFPFSGFNGPKFLLTTAQAGSAGRFSRAQDAKDTAISIFTKVLQRLWAKIQRRKLLTPQARSLSLEASATGKHNVLLTAQVCVLASTSHAPG